MKSRALLTLLSDGQVHSGERLAQQLGVSRTAVWKQVRRALDKGYDIQTVRGRGYKLARPLDLLDENSILCALPEAVRGKISLTVMDEVGSTNTEVLSHMSDSTSATPVVIADSQTEGRGRRGRSWRSPRGENLNLSIGLTFHGGFAVLDGLSLVLGVAVAESLEKLGVPEVRLKWPNDIFLPGGKLGGILVELQGELQEGVVRVVAGVGINVHMEHADDVEQSWSSLVRHCPDRAWTRNELAPVVIAALLDNAEAFSQYGFERFRERWQARDMLQGQYVQARGGETEGTAAGIDAQGNYLIATGSGVVAVRAGEVSLRVSP